MAGQCLQTLFEQYSTGSEAKSVYLYFIYVSFFYCIIFIRYICPEFIKQLILVNNSFKSEICRLCTHLCDKISLSEVVPMGKKRFWILITIGITLVITIILVSNIIEVGLRLREIHEYIEYGFYGLCVILVYFLFINPDILKIVYLI